MTTSPGVLDPLHADITEARRKQMAARMAWARSANADTIAAEKAATRWVDVLLDRLLLRHTTGVPL